MSAFRGRRGAFTGAAFGVATAVVAAALMISSSASGTGVKQVIRPGSYELDTSLAAMTEFEGNADVVVADVTAVEPARWNTVDGKAPADPLAELSFIFTPVRVRVVDVLRGDTALGGREITVRRFDGTVGGTTFEPHSGPNVALRDGQRVVLFLQEDHPLDDGRTDRIPNAAYLLRQDGTLVGPEGPAGETLSALRGLLGLA